MAKRTTKKLTANQREYAKQVKRIKQAISRATKRGYMFEGNILPQKPKRITQKAIETLKQITPKTLYSKAQYVDKNTGEIVSGTEGVKQERKERARKASETRKRNKQARQDFWSGVNNTQSDTYYPDGGEIIFYNVLEDFILKLSTPTPTKNFFGRKRQQLTYEASERGRATLYSLTMRVRSEIGDSELGWRIQERSDEVEDLLSYVLYGSDAGQIASATSQLANIITGGTLTMSDLMDIAEEEESNESWESPS